MAVVAAGLLAACSGAGHPPQGTGDAPGATADPGAALRITTVSGPPAYVTGGDAVVAVDSPAGGSLDGVTVSLDGTDVTDRFTPDTSPHRVPGAAPRLLAHLTGLPPGPSTLTAAEGSDTASLTITDHDIAGPLFSGPHQSPFVCATEKAGLGPPGDECGAATTVSWRYVTTAGAVRDLPDPTSVPADVSTTVTTEGARVPFVVRVETAVLNRAIVETAILDPHPGDGRRHRRGRSDGTPRAGTAGSCSASAVDAGSPTPRARCSPPRSRPTCSARATR